MRLMGFGHALFALALVGFGVLGLVSGDFAYLWQGVPPWVPRPVLALLSSALLLACGAGLLWPRMRARASLVLVFYGLASMLLVHVPHIVQRPGKVALWFGLSEVAIIVAGACVVGQRRVPLARKVFGLALLPVGLSHFVYAAMTASLVPSWLPAHTAWVYLTGAGHLAAGVAVLIGVLPRLAALLEALMVSTFVLTIHVPTVVRAPGDPYQWAELFVACAIAGVAFLMAHSYRATS